MATLDQLEYALAQADKAGDTNAARQLAAVIGRARADAANQIPGSQIPETQPRQPEPSLGDKVVGAGEAALSTGTALTGGTVGMILGTFGQLAKNILDGSFGTRQAADAVEARAAKGAESLTYHPRTETGQEYASSIGETLQNVLPVTPMTAELAALGRGAAAAAPAASVAARSAAAPVVSRVQQAAQGIREMLPASAEAPKPTPGTGSSVGAAGVDAATLRQSRADELPVPIDLTKGQKTRSFEQQRFERETAKEPTAGAPIRERFAEQNRQLQQNLDSFIDSTGAEATDLRSIGLSVDKALRDRAARDKTNIRTLYKEAEKSGEMESPVTMTALVDHLNESAPEAEVANVLKAARAKALQLGVAREEAGQLVAEPVTLKNAELFRKSVNAATNAEPTNIRQAAIMKGLVDDATEGQGGALYKQARQARARYAQNYENISLVKNLLGTKNGSADRAVALEDVLRRSVLEPSTSLDTVKQVRRLLQTEGPNGQQAWKELQGGTLRYIRDEATKGVARDETGAPIISASQLDRAITGLDKTGKLDFVFGKKGAEQLRTINDVAKDVMVAPPGAVNNSNTAGVLLAAMDMAVSGFAGVPAPILSSVRIIGNSVRDAKLRARVNQALGTQGASK